jgi:hypothetical protein
MTLPSSGTITLLEVKTEFGGPGNLINYHRGGSYVANTTTNAGIPTSGIIRLEQFYGASNSAYNVYSYTLTSGYQANGGYTASGFKSSTVGTIESFNNSFGSISGTTLKGNTIYGLFGENQTYNPYFDLYLYVGGNQTPSSLLANLWFTDSAGGNSVYSSANVQNYTYYSGPNVTQIAWRDNDATQSTGQNIRPFANSGSYTIYFNA